MANAIVANIEAESNDAIEKIDAIVHRVSLSTIGKGFHINKWPDGVLNKCYRCKAKFEDPEDISEFFSKLFDVKGEDNFFLYFMKAVAILAIGFYIYIYSLMFMKKKTCVSTMQKILKID